MSSSASSALTMSSDCVEPVSSLVLSSRRECTDTRLPNLMSFARKGESTFSRESSVVGARGNPIGSNAAQQSIT